MPVLKVDLAADTYDDTALAAFAEKATRLFAEVLDSPEDRIRVYLNLRPPAHVTIGGVRGDQCVDAPFFECFLLAGRPPEHRTRLLREFTELLCSELGADRSRVRGCCTHVDPEDWTIGGRSAAEIRAAEIEARKERAANR